MWFAVGYVQAKSLGKKKQQQFCLKSWSLSAAGSYEQEVKPNFSPSTSSSAWHMINMDPDIIYIMIYAYIYIMHIYIFTCRYRLYLYLCFAFASFSKGRRGEQKTNWKPNVTQP